MSSILEKFKALPADKKAFTTLLAVAVLAMIFAWYSPTAVTSPIIFTPATPIKGTDVPKAPASIKSGTIKVIPKPVVKKFLPEVPLAIIEDANIQVPATAEVPSSEHGSKVVATVDVTTGDVNLLVKENKAPLFALENKRRVGIGYGIGTLGTTAKLFGEYGFARIGNVHLAVQGEIVVTDTRAPEARISVLADYRF